MCESPCVNVVATPFKDELKGVPSYVEMKNPSFDTSLSIDVHEKTSKSENKAQTSRPGSSSRTKPIVKHKATPSFSVSAPSPEYKP